MSSPPSRPPLLADAGERRSSDSTLFAGSTSNLSWWPVLQSTVYTPSSLEIPVCLFTMHERPRSGSAKTPLQAGRPLGFSSNTGNQPTSDGLTKALPMCSRMFVQPNVRVLPKCSRVPSRSCYCLRSLQSFLSTPVIEKARKQHSKTQICICRYICSQDVSC